MIFGHVVDCFTKQLAIQCIHTQSGIEHNFGRLFQRLSTVTHSNDLMCCKIIKRSFLRGSIDNNYWRKHTNKYHLHFNLQSCKFIHALKFYHKESIKKDE